MGLTEFEIDLGKVKDLITASLQEDIATGDITTDNLIPEEVRVNAYMKAKEEGVVAGLPFAELAFRQLDSSLVWKPLHDEGSPVSKGDRIVEFTASYRAVLTGERTALNILQRLSGIASQTGRFVEKIKNYKTEILDTRKTLPGFRMLDKYAVKMGGGTNHRIGLFDMVMIKDNHIKVAGGIQKAFERVKENVSEDIKIEIEAASIEDAEEALSAGADIIMLDNMSLEDMAQSVKIINGRALTEASGNMSLDRVEEVAKTGVDYISVGALTHSVNALDIGQYID